MQKSNEIADRRAGDPDDMPRRTGGTANLHSRAGDPAGPQRHAGGPADRLNGSPRSILLHCLEAAAGLVIFSVGIYATIQANIGVGPWDCLCLGVQSTWGFKYGNVSVCVALTVLCIDLLLKEKIGLGTILDSFIVGKTIDLCNCLNFIPPRDSAVEGIAVMVAGLFLAGAGQLVYMRVGLCCGPRDSLLLGVSKRLSRVPIGAVSIIILAAVLFLGWRLGGPIGIGTVISTLFMGPIMQLVFRIARFDAKGVKHQDVLTSVAILTGRAR